MSWKTILKKKKRWTDEKPVNTGWGGANAKTHAKNLAAKEKKKKETSDFRATHFGASLLDLKQAETQFKTITEKATSHLAAVSYNLNNIYETYATLDSMVKEYGWIEDMRHEDGKVWYDWYGDKTYLSFIPNIVKSSITLTDNQRTDIISWLTRPHQRHRDKLNNKAEEYLLPNLGQGQMPNELDFTDEAGLEFAGDLGLDIEYLVIEYNKDFEIFIKYYEEEYLPAEKKVDVLRAKHQSLRNDKKKP